MYQNFYALCEDNLFYKLYIFIEGSQVQYLQISSLGLFLFYWINSLLK